MWVSYEKALRTEGGQERLDNLAELKQYVYEYETTCGKECTLEHYLTHVALFTNSDTGDQGDKAKLMTVRAAKSLEFQSSYYYTSIIVEKYYSFILTSFNNNESAFLICWMIKE